MSGDSNKKIAFNYFGGKFTWVDHIIKYFPDHIHFIDVFCGSLAITLNKEPSNIDTANDINSEVINFFRVLREQPDQLLQLLKLTPISREEYNICWTSTVNGISDLEKARRFYVRVRQSYCGLGIQRKNKGWHMVKTQSRANMGETVSKWRNAIIKLEDVIDRLTSIQIENKDFRKLIFDIDYPGAFFYCDPPYPLDCRKSHNDYKYDFKKSDHEDLAEILHSIKGKAMISGYRSSKTMMDLYKDWRLIVFPSKANNIRSGKVEECVWINYDPEAQQNNLFNSANVHLTK